MKIENNNLISESETRKRISYRGYIIRPCKSDDGELYYDIIKPKWNTTEPIWDWCDSVEEAKRWIDSDKDEPFEDSLIESAKIVNEGRRYAKGVTDRLKAMLNIGWMDNAEVKTQEYNTSLKQNYVIVPTQYHELDKDKINDFKSRLKSIGAKYILSKYGKIYFYFDDSALIKAKEDEQAEFDAQYANELDGIDIDQYKPNDRVLDKLKGYRAKGSKVNVNAIKDVNKLLTYYYAACLLGWNDLAYSVNQNIPFEYHETVNAIDKRVKASDDLVDNRSESEKSLYDKFKRVADYLAKANISYTFSKRQPTSTELELDRRNGRCWTIAYTLKINDSLEIKFADHTNEGGGTYGYSINGSELMSKASCENAIISMIKSNIPEINEQMQRTPKEDGWPDIVKDITAQFFDRAAAIKYEIDNCVRGSFTVRGRGTVEDLITDLKELSIDLDYAIKDLTRDKANINEALDWQKYKITYSYENQPDKEYTDIFTTHQNDVEYAWRMSNQNVPHTKISKIERINESTNFSDEMTIFKRDLELANSVDDIKDLITNLSDAELKDVLKSEFDTAATNISSLQKLKDHLSDVSDIYVEELDDMMFNEANKVSPLNKKYKGYMIRMDHKYGGYNVYDKYDELEDSGFKSIEAAEKFVDSLDESAKVSNLNLSRNNSSNESYSIDDITYETKQSLKNDSAKSFGYDYWYHDSGNILNHKNKIIATYDMDKKRKHKKQYGTYGPVHDSKQFYSPSCEYVVNFNDDYFDTHIPPLKYKGPGDENQMIRKVKSYLKSYFKVNGSNAILNAKKSINDSINESIKTTSVEPVFKLDRPTKSTLTKNKKYDITFDKNGNFIASTRHGKKFYVYGNIKDANDSVQNDEDMIAAAVREQISIQFNESSTLSKLVKSGYSRKEIQKFFKDETGLDMTPENSEEFKRWSAKFLNSIEESTDRTKSVYCCSECGFEGELFDDECEDLCCPNCHDHHGGFGKCEESICSKYAIYMNDKFQEYVTGTEEDAKERIKDYQREDEADRTMFMLNGIDMPTYTYKLVESDEAEDNIKMFNVDENFRIRESNNIVG